MKAILLPALLSFVFSTLSPAQTCREVVRDASGRVVQTIDRQKQADGGGHNTYRDASGRIAGSATSKTTASGGSSTTYRDASGRLAGSATTSNFSGSGSRTQFRDASGRLIGSSSGSGKCQGAVRVSSPPIGNSR
jgi:hypothetical protein